MTNGVLHFLHQVMGSPWVYLAIFVVSMVDGFFPAVPSETSVITAGVFAATGEPNLVLVIVAAALGAFAGDHISYGIGRTAGGRLVKRMRRGTRSLRAYEWAAKALTERGGLILVVARYIPGGRTAATMTTGAARFPLRSFSLFDSVAAISWGIYSALIGFLGGMAFENDPLKGLVLGVGLAITVTVIAEVARGVRRRGRTASNRRPPGMCPASRSSQTSNVSLL